MVMEAKVPSDRLVLDLDGSQGNAFCLLGHAHSTMRKSGFTKDIQERIMNEYELLGAMAKFEERMHKYNKFR